LGNPPYGRRKFRRTAPTHGSNDDLCVESVLGGDLCTPIFKDGDVYRACHPKPEIGCRWFFERIEAGNTEGY